MKKEYLTPLAELIIFQSKDDLLSYSKNEDTNNVVDADGEGWFFPD